MQFIFDMKIGNKTVKARAFTYREFQQMIAAKAEGKLAEVIVETIHNCTDIDALELSKQEAELLFLLLWCHSLDKMKFTATWVCDDCKKETEYDLDVNKVRTTDNNPYFLDLGKIKLQFRNPRFTEDSDIMQMVINCIDFIVFNDQQFDLNELSEHEFNTILNMLTKEHIEDIIEELTKNQITLAVPIKCECGQSGVYSITGLSEFFNII